MHNEEEIMLKSRMERFGIKRRDLVVGVAVGIPLVVSIIVFRLGALGVSADQPVTIPAIAANAPAPLAPLTVQSSRQEVIGLMLNSHTKWHTLEGKAITLLRDGQTDPTNLLRQGFKLSNLERCAFNPGQKVCRQRMSG
jgi:hypothetical protein